MAVNSVNISIDKSTNYSETFSIKNSDGTVMDLTGYTGVSKIRKHATAVAVQDFTVGIASTTGKVTLSMASTVTSEIKDGRNYYDIVITSVGGTVTKIQEGSAIVNPTISA